MELRGAGGQGLTLVHFPARREQVMMDPLGDFRGLQ